MYITPCRFYCTGVILYHSRLGNILVDKVVAIMNILFAILCTKCEYRERFHTYIHTLTHIQCNRTSALEALFESTLFPSTKIAVIGSGCSPATEPTAEVSHFYNISQVSWFKRVKLVKHYI